MDCPHIPELGYGEFSQRLHSKVAGQRIPIVGSMELTFRCNLRCVHCYLDHPRTDVSGSQELSHAEICSLLDQVAEQGCLWLLLTGGEIFVRPDILDNYLYAKRKGMLVTLFTNGTLITPRIADTLAEWRPFSVEITLYGRTQETYERITGVPGSHARCMQGIELLLERGVPLELKTMLMTLNQDEVWDIKTYAEGLGVAFRYDPMINATLDGGQAPTRFRLLPEDIVRFELADARRVEEWRAFYQRSLAMRADPRYLYACGAGLHTFHIDPYGKLSVCVISREPGYDLRRGSFGEGWQALRQVRYRPPSAGYTCHQCELLALCGQCPGWAQLEHGNSEQVVTFLCQVAHLRAQHFVLSEQPVEIEVSQVQKSQNQHPILESQHFIQGVKNEQV